MILWNATLKRKNWEKIEDIRSDVDDSVDFIVEKSYKNRNSLSKYRDFFVGKFYLGRVMNYRFRIITARIFDWPPLPKG